MLLMNGIGARLELLQPLVDRLQPRRTIVGFDAPGVGGSPPPLLPYRLTHLSRLIGRCAPVGFEVPEFREKIGMIGIAAEFSVADDL